MGILDRVTKASEADADYLKCLVWGPTGTGKSTLCGTAPKPVLYLYTEKQGLISFKRMCPDGDVLEIDSVDTLRAVLTDLRRGTDYATVCLDSFTEMQVLIVNEVLAMKDRVPGEPVKASTQDFMFIHDRSKALVRAFRDLPMHVVVTCLSETVVVGEDENARTVTRMMLTGRKLPAQLAGFFNLVGFSHKTLGPNNVTIHRVGFEGPQVLDVKGMPGLRKKEEPDIEYWVRVGIKGDAPRDPDASLIAPVSRSWGVTEQKEG